LVGHDEKRFFSPPEYPQKTWCKRRLKRTLGSPREKLADQNMWGGNKNTLVAEIISGGETFFFQREKKLFRNPLCGKIFQKTSRSGTYRSLSEGFQQKIHQQGRGQTIMVSCTKKKLCCFSKTTIWGGVSLTNKEER